MNSRLWTGAARALLLCTAVHSSPPAVVQGPTYSEARLARVRALPFLDLFRQIAGPYWIGRHSQARAESNLNPRVRATDGGMGLGQFMPATWADWGNGDPFDPRANATAQHHYMLWLEARTGSYNAALGAYNAGLGNIRRAQRLADDLGLEGQDTWLRTLPRVTHANATITQAYIGRNAGYRAELREAFP